MKKKCKVFRWISWMLAFALVIFSVPLFEAPVVEAAGSVLTSSDGLWKYELKEESGETVAVVDGYNGTDRDLVIPGEIDGYVAKYIGKPSGWSTVDLDCFDSITIPDNIAGFSNTPFFSHSHNLNFVSLGKNFATYNYIRDINMIKGEEGYGIQTKEYRVSSENEVITAVDGVLYSKDMTTLELYPVLKEDTVFTVPDGVTSIGSCAMNNQQYLENLILPEGLQKIGTYCFEGASIRSVNLPNSLTSLDYGIFYESKLESIVIPETITEIGGCVFTGTPLVEVVIPDTVVSLGVDDFKNCDKLKSIVIGSGVASIGEGCFSGLTALKTFEISEANANFKSEGGLLLTKDGLTLIQYAVAGNTQFILPNGVTAIADKACYGMPFTEIIVPDTVVTIGYNAFENCTKAESAYIPSSVTVLRSDVFSGCTSLKTVTIDAQVTRINDFGRRNAITELTLPETATSVADSVFIGDSLRTVRLRSSQAPSISYSIYPQGKDPQAELIKRAANVRIFVPEGAQGYDVLPWSRMRIVYGDAIPAERLTLNPSCVILNVGETAALQPAVLPEDAVVQEYVWDTSEKSVASVDQNGQVKALSAGTAKIKVTAGELSTECFVTVRGEQPPQDFRVETSGGTASNNYNAQNYDIRSNPMKSYLFENQEGRLERAEFIDGKLVYETYGMDGTLKESGNIPDELPLVGGFYVSDMYRFVIYGQTNSEESDDMEVMRIVKYDQDWNRVSSCSLYGENTKVPFNAGSLRFAENGDKLYIRTCHTMYGGHQSNLQVTVDMPSMEVTDVFSKVANINNGGYVSHSFNQFLQMDGEDLIALDHGDAYPRAAVLIKYPGIKDTTFAGASIEYCNALVFPGTIGNNATGASLGGLEVSEHYYMFAGKHVNNSASPAWNIFVNITDKNFLREQDTRMVYLTDYDADSGVTVSTPQLVKINEKTFLVLWNETDIIAERTIVHSQLIDEDGNKVTAEQSFHGSLSDCHPMVQNGQVVWYYTGTLMGESAPPIFCRISVDGRETTDNLLETEKKTTISADHVSLSQTSYVFDGTAKEPEVTVKVGDKTLVKDIDYTLSYEDNINVGTGKVSVTGTGDYTGTVTKEFAITEAEPPVEEPKELSQCSITLSETAYIYDGTPKTPAVTVRDGNKTLLEDIDYTLSYEDNINVGTGKVSVTGTGTGDYTGTVTKEFTITEAEPPVEEPKELSQCIITLSETAYIYDGTPKTPTVTVRDGNKTLLEDTDYTLSYKDNINVGTGKVSVTGIGNYTGTETKEFAITEAEPPVEEPKELSQCIITLSETAYIYDGTPKTPTVTVKDGNKTLLEDTDYTLSYEDNINVGTGKVSVTGIGDYTGTETKEFTITEAEPPVQEPKELSQCIITLSETAYTYDGTPKTPTVTVRDGNKTLLEDTDYTLSYENNINVGTGKVSVTGTGDYTGTVTKEFAITKAAPPVQEVKEVSQCIITLSQTAYTYDGTPKTPMVTVRDGNKTLLKDTDYTLVYENNINAGTGKVTITGTADYKGTVKKSFTITVKKGTSHKVGSCQYKITSASTVSMTAGKNKKATKVKVPKTVKIGGKTFKVTAIGSKAFKNNKKIKSVEIGDNVKIISTSAFEGCTKLSKAVLGKWVTEIGRNTFKNCRKLKTITIKSKKLKKIGKSALKNIKTSAKIKVPAKKLSAYKKLLRNKGQGKKVKIVK